MEESKFEAKLKLLSLKGLADFRGYSLTEEQGQRARFAIDALSVKSIEELMIRANDLKSTISAQVRRERKGDTWSDDHPGDFSLG